MMGGPVTKAAERFTETEIEDEVVVMHLDSGEFFSLTDTARAIWKLIDGTRSRDEIVAAMAQTHSADPETVSADVGDFLTELGGAGLLASG